MTSLASCCYLPPSPTRLAATRLAGTGFCVAFYSTQRSHAKLLCQLRLCSIPVEVLVIASFAFVQCWLAIREGNVSLSYEDEGIRREEEYNSVSQKEIEETVSRGSTIGHLGPPQECALDMDASTVRIRLREDLELTKLPKIERKGSGGEDDKVIRESACSLFVCAPGCLQLCMLLLGLSAWHTIESAMAFSYKVRPSASFWDKINPDHFTTNTAPCPDTSMSSLIPNWNPNCPVSWRSQVWRFWRRTFRRYSLVLIYGFFDPAPMYGETMPTLADLGNGWDPRLADGRAYIVQSERRCSRETRLRIVVTSNRPWLVAASRAVWMPWLIDKTEVYVATVLDNEAWADFDLPIQVYNASYSNISELLKAQSVNLQVLKHHALLVEQGEADFSWLAMLDDDVFLNPPNLHNLLDRFCADDFVVLGERGFGSPGRLLGGAGMIFSHGALADMDWRAFRACQLPGWFLGSEQVWAVDVDITSYIDNNWATRWRLDIAGNRAVQDVKLFINYPPFIAGNLSLDGRPDDVGFFRYVGIHRARTAGLMESLQYQLCGGKGLCRGPEDYRGENTVYSKLAKWTASKSHVVHLDYCTCSHNNCGYNLRLANQQQQKAIFSDCLHGSTLCGEMAGFYPRLYP